jgi:hypothetical protein
LHRAVPQVQQRPRQDERRTTQSVELSSGLGRASAVLMEAVEEMVGGIAMVMVGVGVMPVRLSYLKVVLMNGPMCALSLANQGVILAPSKTRMRTAPHHFHTHQHQVRALSLLLSLLLLLVLVLVLVLALPVI